MYKVYRLFFGSTYRIDEVAICKTEEDAKSLLSVLSRFDVSRFCTFNYYKID